MPAGERPEAAVWHWTYEEKLSSSLQTLRDYTFTNPRYNQEHQSVIQGANVLGESRQGHYERYDYPGRYKRDAQGKPFTQYRLEYERREAEVAFAQSDDLRVQPGVVFGLTGHARDAFNRDWLIVGVEHKQFGRHPKLFAPHDIFKLLFPHSPIPPDVTQLGWAENWQEPTFPTPVFDKKTQEKDTALFGEPLPELKCYFILDANKCSFFSPERFQCRIESLFQGEFAETTKDIAPYLVEVIPYPDYCFESELMGLFSDETAMTRFHWHEQLGIFIHSRYDFDTVLHHLRRFPMMKDENNKWFFFRFYDPNVLRNYLEVIATSPEKLNKFFGYEKRIIHAFACGVGDTFNYYQLKALPEETRNIPIILTEFELNGFKDKKWLETREKMVGYIFKTYPKIYPTQDMEQQLIRNLDEARNKGYIYETSIVQYAVAKQSAVKNGQDFFALEKNLEQAFPAPLERAIQLFNLFNLE